MKNDREKIYSKAAILLMIDQFLKILVTNNMKMGEKIAVIPNFFAIYYLKNSGAAFSILENKTFLLIILSFAFLLIIDNYLKKEKKFNKIDIVAWGMIIGGVLGNLIDRLLYHGVVDYLSFYLGNNSFPIFNFADMCITGGIFLYFISIFFENKKTKEEKKK